MLGNSRILLNLFSRNFLTLPKINFDVFLETFVNRWETGSSIAAEKIIFKKFALLRFSNSGN